MGSQLEGLILEMVSLNYVNLLDYFLFYFYIGLTVHYSFHLYDHIQCGDFNLTTFYHSFGAEVTTSNLSSSVHTSPSLNIENTWKGKFRSTDNSINRKGNGKFTKK